jgi:hypothetical protein
MNENSNDATASRDLDLEFTRAKVNAAFDRWHYWQQRLRDLLNAADRYMCETFDISAREIKERMRHAHLDTMSKLYRFECLRERIEKEKTN